MKKILLTLAILAGTAGMSAAVYMTTCGVPVNSVDMEFFDTLGEWIDYVEEMNEIECGTRGSGAIQQKNIQKAEYVVL